MSWRLFVLSILMGMKVFLVWNNYQETGSLSKSMNKSWRDVTNSDVVTEAKRAWQKSSRQASTIMKKLKDGRLMQEAVKFVDKVTVALFNVKTPGLQTELQRYEKAWLDCILLVVWLLTGYVSSWFLSGSTCLFTMATTLLVHALYGPAWCMYELVVLVGLLVFILSVIANNAVFTAFIISGFYCLHALWRFVGPSDGNRLDRLELRMAHVQAELNEQNKQLNNIEDKVDLLKAIIRESK